MYLVLIAAFQWLIRTVLVKVIAFTAVFGLVVAIAPVAIAHLAPYLGTTGLNSAFSGLPNGVSYFLGLFRLDYGIPLLISATVSRFLIRRLPVIG